MIKVEHIVQESIQRDRETTETQNIAIKEKIKSNWERIMVIIEELKTAIDEGSKAQVKNKQTIDNVRNSIEGIVLGAAESVVNEASAKAAETIKEMQGSIDALTEQVEEEADLAA